jgi:hypothetical protein
METFFLHITITSSYFATPLAIVEQFISPLKIGMLLHWSFPASFVGYCFCYFSLRCSTHYNKLQEVASLSHASFYADFNNTSHSLVPMSN